MLSESPKAYYIYFHNRRLISISIRYYFFEIYCETIWYSIAPTLVVISSDDDTENQSVASRTRFQRARQRTPAIAPPIENITNDPPPTSQPTDNNPLTNLQDRQRAPKQQLSRCLEDGTRIDLSLSEISDEEVDYGSFASIANSDTDSDRSWTPL